MQQVSIEEARTILSDLIKAVNEGEEVVITEDSQPVVKLMPVTQEKTRPQFGSAKGLIIIHDDFDEPLEDFKEYME